jgi:deazaflavin-dependent oxidoreductase (nitroreductase family)
VADPAGHEGLHAWADCGVPSNRRSPEQTFGGTELHLADYDRRSIRPATHNGSRLRPHGEKLLVIASANGAPTNPAWYRNLQARSRAVVELGATKFEVHPRIATRDERRELAKSIWYFEDQQNLTEREIPIVILERIED